jgi:hypothetical protein
MLILAYFFQWDLEKNARSNSCTFSFRDQITFSYEVWAATETVQLLKEARGFKLEIEVAFVINRCVVKTASRRGIEETLAEYLVMILKTVIAQQVAFAET